jgi:anaerobic magnesium-protoporphyrin IX monomethyl ester cyclase
MLRCLLIPAPHLHRRRILPHVPYGLLSLQSAANEYHTRCEILPLWDLAPDRLFDTADELAEVVAQAVDGDRYDAVGLSVTCGTFHHSLSIAAVLGERYPRLEMWLGGPHVSMSPDLILERFPEIGAVFVGEGVATFGELLARQAEGLDTVLSDLDGVHRRNSPFVVRSQIQDLDDLPLIARAVDFLPIFTISAGVSADGVPLEVERGCPGRCTFCSTRHHWGSRLRYKTPARVAREMDDLYALTGERFFALIGDDLAGSPRQLREMCQYLSRHRPDFRWAGCISLGQLETEDLDLLWAAGCRGFFVGVESGSQRTLDRIGKRLDLSRGIPLLRRAIDRGFLIEASFIVGFPWEAKSDIRETCRLHTDLVGRGIFFSQVKRLCPLSGTDLERSHRSSLHSGRGDIPLSAGMEFGPLTRSLVERCPEMFIHLGHLETESASFAEVGASVVAAGVVARDDGRRMKDWIAD